MTFFLKRLVDAVRGNRPSDTAADDALEQLRRTNQMVTEYRKAKTRRGPSGNRVQDMITGMDGPQPRSEQ